MPKSLPLATALMVILWSHVLWAANPREKSPLTLDEFFNSVEIHSVKISPDGHAVVIETVRADWDRERFRSDLWLYRDEGGPGGPTGIASLGQLTQSGHDRSPEWSPDGHWIAFVSDREAPRAAVKDADGEEGSGSKAEHAPAQVYLIAVGGGEAFPVTYGEEDVHAFAWSADSGLIYFATRTPWTKQQQENHKKEWHDVIRFRESERGDVISSVEVQAAISQAISTSGRSGQGESAPSGVRAVATTSYRIQQLAASPDGKRLAFMAESRSERHESMEPYAIYLVDLPAGQPRLLSHTQAVYDHICWAPDGRHVFFSFLNGSAEGPYQDAQPRVYWVDAAANSPNPAGALTRWGASFGGAITGFEVPAGGELLAAGRTGTEVQVYSQGTAGAKFVKRPGWDGTYEHLSAATHSGRIAFVYSALDKPTEVYLAEGADKLQEARPITSFNKLFTEHALPQGKPYCWTADDGATVEGMLIYPPGKLGAEHLRMFTLIHGGPEDADGNHFEADWYQWGALAATNGWLVFEPNYRGSIGYGDHFALGIIPKIVSRPGKDILEGIDALVKDGIADPDHLTVGGYSYGGYMTNWLIAQTTRFKAAVSGAGAVEHVANWGNDDTTFDDAYFLGGLPWEAETNYNNEAAIWQFAKVRTPTHVVGGSEDIRVYVGEDYLLERALHALGIPTTLLIFPGEGHELDQNPWHGKIKVREEMKWLEKYGGQ